MRWRVWLLTAAALLSSPVLAGDWNALSTTAIGITGDVTLDEHRIAFDGERSYRITKIRLLSASELDAMRDLTGSRTATEATLYKINIPARIELRNGNTLCGRAATTRMVAARESVDGQKLLSLIFFSGSKAPFFEGWKDTADSGVCGSFHFLKR